MKNTYNPQTVTHPKDFLKESMEEINLSISDLKSMVNFNPEDIDSILKGNMGISEEHAIEFQQIFQVPIHFWLKAQELYNKSLENR